MSLLRLFGRDYPNHFNAPAFDTWWGYPLRWEAAVLVVGAACAVLLLWAPFRWTRTPLASALAIMAPLVFGLIATPIQIHMLIYTMGRAGWSSTTTPFEHLFPALFSSHVGVVTSLALLLLWGVKGAFLRRVKAA